MIRLSVRLEKINFARMQQHTVYTKYIHTYYAGAGQGTAAVRLHVMHFHCLLSVLLVF